MATAPLIAHSPSAPEIDALERMLCSQAALAKALVDEHDLIVAAQRFLAYARLAADRQLPRRHTEDLSDALDILLASAHSRGQLGQPNVWLNADPALTEELARYLVIAWSTTERPIAQSELPLADADIGSAAGQLIAFAWQQGVLGKRFEIIEDLVAGLRSLMDVAYRHADCGSDYPALDDIPTLERALQTAMIFARIARAKLIA